MTTPPAGMNDLAANQLLLAMAGRIPDATLSAARRLLADGALTSAFSLLASQLARTPVSLTGDELDSLRTLSGDPQALPEAEPIPEPPAHGFSFSEWDPYGEVDRDELDDAVVAAVEGSDDSLVGVWRTWRYGLPADEPDELWDDSPHRVYLVQVTDPEQIQRVAAAVLGVVPDSAGAGVEVIQLGQDLPPYQAAALAQARLLWATDTEPEFQLARIFDFADPVTGPGFLPGHPVVDNPAERELLIGYLRGGFPVMTTSARMNDLLDPDAGAVVPTSFRTDGEWIWTDTVPYYLERHGLEPDAELTAHIRQQFSRGSFVPDTDREAAIRASDFLLNPPPAHIRTPVWTMGGRPPS